MSNLNFDQLFDTCEDNEKLKLFLLKLLDLLSTSASNLQQTIFDLSNTFINNGILDSKVGELVYDRLSIDQSEKLDKTKILLSLLDLGYLDTYQYGESIIWYFKDYISGLYELCKTSGINTQSLDLVIKSTTSDQIAYFKHGSLYDLKQSNYDMILSYDGLEDFDHKLSSILEFVPQLEQVIIEKSVNIVNLDGLRVYEKIIEQGIQERINTIKSFKSFNKMFGMKDSKQQCVTIADIQRHIEKFMFYQYKILGKDKQYVQSTVYRMVLGLLGTQLKKEVE